MISFLLFQPQEQPYKATQKKTKEDPMAVGQKENPWGPQCFWSYFPFTNRFLGTFFDPKTPINSLDDSFEKSKKDEDSSLLGSPLQRSRFAAAGAPTAPGRRRGAGGRGGERLGGGRWRWNGCTFSVGSLTTSLKGFL